MKSTLLFVYNADSTLFARVSDAVHKVVSPATYACNLCKITYSSISVKKEWKDYIQSLDSPVRFLHKDQFLAEFPTYNTWNFPLVARQKESELDLVISSTELNSIESMDRLIKRCDLENAI